MNAAASLFKKKAPYAKKEYPRSLMHTVSVWLLALSLVPVLVVGTVTYFRTRSMLTQQANTQLQAIVDNSIAEIVSYSLTRQMTLLNMLQQSQAGKWLEMIEDPNVKPTDLEIARNRLLSDMQARLGLNPDPMFNEIFLVDPDGKVLASTNSKRLGKNYRNDSEIQQMVGTSRAAGIYNVPGLFSGDYTMLTSVVYQSKTNEKKYTFIGAIDTPLMKNTLVQGGKFLRSGRMYLFNRGNLILGISNRGNLLSYENNGSRMDSLRSVTTSAENSGTMSYTSYGGAEVLSYARWQPTMGLGLVLEVPQDVVYEQLRFLGPFYLLVLVFSLLVGGVFVAFGTRSIVSPILKLVDNVRAFAQGDFNRRAEETRKDELGLLGHSFNAMADQIGQMYRSLETKVEERNQQLMTAAELSQVATSSGNREEILRQTVTLVTERFDYGYASIYLLDSSGSFFTAREAGGRLNESLPGAGLDQRIRTTSAFGLAIANNQVTMLQQPAGQGAERPETLLPKARSEVIVPVAAGGQVLGLLDIQSELADTFSEDTISVLKMLATQVANGLQNIQLFENTKVDLQEINLLYRASRQVTQVTESKQIGQILADTVAQTPYLGMVLTANETQLRATAVFDAQRPDRNVPVLIITRQRVEQQLLQNNYLLFDALNTPGEFYSILNYFDQNGCTQAAFLPVKVDGAVTQVLILASRKAGSLTDTSLQPYLSFVEVVANTEARFSVLRNLENNLSEMKTVSAINEALSVETDLQVLFRLLHNQIMENMGGSVDFSVALYDDTTRMIRKPYLVQYGSQKGAAPYPLGDDVTSMMIKRGEPLLLSRNAVQGAAALGAKYTGIPARSMVAVPLVLAGKLIGVMAAEDLETDGRFTERELSLFTTLAPQVTVAIRNAQLLTEMQQALKAYDQERFLLNTLLDNIPDQIYFKDPAGHYIRGSQSLLASLGLKNQEELVGRTEAEVTGSEQAPTIRAEEAMVIQTGQSHEGIIEKYEREDGSEEWALVSRLPMVNENGSVSGLLAISRDITGLKQAEELAQRRAQQLRTAAEIARDTSGTLNVEELLSKSVNLVRDRFGFYHASIFLVDALGEYAVLRESTGEAGRSLKSAGHRLAVGSQSIVGQCTARGEALVVNNITQDPNYYPNPLLPDTRAELSIPLKAGERVVGAMDVQSTTVNAFQSDDINILQILADQLAIAIVNADMFVETQENLTKHRFLHQITTAAASAGSLDEALETTVRGLVTAMGNEHVAVYMSHPDGSLGIRAYSGYQDEDVHNVRVQPGEGVIGLTALGRHPILIKDTQNDSRYTAIDSRVRSVLAVPILYSDRAVGVLSIESDRVAAFDENDQEILGSLGNNLGAILANTQLVSQVRQQVEQQKNLFEITSKIRRSASVETVLQTSVREICRAMNAQRASIHITAGEASLAAGDANPGSSSGSNGHNGHHGNGHRETA